MFLLFVMLTITDAQDLNPELIMGYNIILIFIAYLEHVYKEKLPLPVM